jgi:hypothetical protein
MITGSVVDHELASIMAQVQRSALSQIVAWEAVCKVSPDPLIMKDYSLLGHLAGVAFWSGELGKLMGMSQYEAALLYYAATLHDWGKVQKRMYWLNRSFTDEEKAKKEQHPVDSVVLMRESYPYQIPVDVMSELRKVELMVLYHHHPEVLAERLPSEMEHSREELERGVFVLHCADIIQARSEKRWNRPELTHSELCGELGNDLSQPRYKVFEGMRDAMLKGIMLVGLAACAA